MTEPKKSVGHLYSWNNRKVAACGFVPNPETPFYPFDPEKHEYCSACRENEAAWRKARRLQEWEDGGAYRRSSEGKR